RPARRDRRGDAPPPRRPARGSAPDVRGGVPLGTPGRSRSMPRHGVSADPRGIAHEILVRVETGDAFADRLLADRAATGRFSTADRGLLTRVVCGTLAGEGRLDHHLRGLVRVPLGRLDPPVRAALRLGLYQLLFLDRVPAYAAVDSSVRLVRRRGATVV